MAAELPPFCAKDLTQTMSGETLDSYYGHFSGR
jgi:hypothetical protein